MGGKLGTTDVSIALHVNLAVIKTCSMEAPSQMASLCGHRPRTLQADIYTKIVRNTQQAIMMNCHASCVTDAMLLKPCSCAPANLANYPRQAVMALYQMHLAILRRVAKSFLDSMVIEMCL